MNVAAIVATLMLICALGVLPGSAADFTLARAGGRDRAIRQPHDFRRLHPASARGPGKA